MGKTGSVRGVGEKVRGRVAAVAARGGAGAAATRPTARELVGTAAFALCFGLLWGGAQYLLGDNTAARFSGGLQMGLAVRVAASLAIALGLLAALFGWLRRFEGLALCETLLTTALAGVVGHALALGLWCAPVGPSIAAALLAMAVGGTAPLWLPARLRPRACGGGEAGGDAAEAPGAGEADGGAPGLASYAQVLLAVPVLCLMLRCFTGGSTMLAVNAGAGATDAAVVVAYALAVCALWRWGRGCGAGSLSFAVFRVAIPVLACVALGIKVVPLAPVNEELFREVMRVAFRMTVLVTWAFVVYTAQTAGRGVSRLLVLVWAACVVCALAGSLLAPFERDVRMGVLGVVTGVYLVYGALSLGKALIEFNKPVDIDEDPAASLPDLDRRSEEIGACYGLTPRENDVLKELARGHSSGYIATAFCISANTARSHMKRIYKKLGVTSREELLELFWREG